MYRSEDDGHRPHQGKTPASNQISGSVRGAAFQAGSIHGDVHIHTPPGVPDLLHQLPAVSPHFVNRRTELRAMARITSEARAQGRTALLCLTGLGGIGKTELAIRFLHDLGGRIDGHLFIDLRGFAHDETVQPADVLHMFLRALAVPAQAIPPDLATRASWWRSATAGRQLGILLDNALSSAQIRTLLPGTGTHVVVVTSRVRLAGLTLDGASLVHIDPLAHTDAAALLLRLTAGAAAPADEHSAQRVAELCGGLPIAVNAVGVQAASGVSLGAVEADLIQRRTRLSALSSEDESVRSAFDLSYDALPEEVARTYRRLGWHVGPDITVPVARSLTGRDEAACIRHLRALATASLLTGRGLGRYRFHDLLDLHARAKAADDEPAQERQAALSRLVSAHAEQAAAADRALRPYAGPPADTGFASPDEALGWLDTERANLLALASYAASHGHTAAALGIAEGMWPLYLHRRDASGWLRAATAALGVVTDVHTRGRLLSKQALALGFLRRDADAHAAFEECEQIWHRLGDRWRLSQTRQRRGLLALGSGHPDHAVVHLRAARALQEEMDQPHDLAITLLGLGRALTQSGRPDEAAPLLRRALQVLEASGDANHAARAHIALARATMHTHPDDAHRVLTSALGAAQQRGSLVGRAEAHEALGDLAAHRAATAQAKEHYQAAVQVLVLMGAGNHAAQVEQRLARMPDQT